MKYIDSFFTLDNFTHSELFYEIKYPWLALSNINNYFEIKSLGKIEIEISQGVTLINPESISIGEGTTIEPGAYIAGPCIIGKNCQIRHGAYLRGNVIIGDRCVIGHATEVKGSIFFNDASASHFNYVGDSILGNRVNLGAGLICANVRLDRQPVEVTFEEERIKTPFKKLGALIGDGSQLGCQCVLNPGTLVGRNVFSHPLLKISGYIVPNSIIRTSQSKV